MIITRGMGAAQDMVVRGLGLAAVGSAIAALLCLRLFEVIPRDRLFSAARRG